MTKRKSPTCVRPISPPARVGIGIDIIETARFLGMRNDQKFLHSVFTKSELDYCQRRKHSHEHFAARYAAKEAVIKALGSYGISARIDEIEILNDRDGRPTVNILTTTARLLDVSISMSHSSGSAVAVAIVTPLAGYKPTGSHK